MIGELTLAGRDIDELGAEGLEQFVLGNRRSGDQNADRDQVHDQRTIQ